jgi:hypothetical protein
LLPLYSKVCSWREGGHKGLAGVGGGAELPCNELARRGAHGHGLLRGLWPADRILRHGPAQTPFGRSMSLVRQIGAAAGGCQPPPPHHMDMVCLQLDVGLHHHIFQQLLPAPVARVDRRHDAARRNPLAAQYA